MEDEIGGLTFDEAFAFLEQKRENEIRESLCQLERELYAPPPRCGGKQQRNDARSRRDGVVHTMTDSANVHEWRDAFPGAYAERKEGSEMFSDKWRGAPRDTFGLHGATLYDDSRNSVCRNGISPEDEKRRAFLVRLSGYLWSQVTEELEPLRRAVRGSGK